MSLVGELILSARELMADLPQSFPTPSILNVATASGLLLSVGTWYIRITIITPFGETAPSNERSIVTTTNNQNVSVAVGVAGEGVNTQVLAVRIYFSQQSQGQVTYQQISPFPANGIVTTVDANTQPDASLLIVNGAPPSRSTAYLPDTDGPAFGAYAFYRALNQALSWAAAKNRGGLPDFGAAGTINGQGNYVMPGWWRKIDSAWFDGYPLGLLQKNNVYRRNPVPGYSGMLIVFQATDRLMLEAWPQPNRTSGQTTLSSGMGSTDTVANLTSSAGYVLGFGMTQIDSEIVYFSAINGNQLTGLQRGMCGTTPASHSTSAPVTELNLMISGYRVPSTYSVGQSAKTLYLPPGWDEALVSYMLYRFRKAEQDEAGAKAAYAEATEKMSGLSANRIIAGPRQISPYAAIGPEVGAGLGTAFGGVIIP